MQILSKDSNRTCGSCARAECVEEEAHPTPPPQPQCVKCPPLYPACNIRCRGGYTCGVQKQTCSTCAHYTCVPYESTTYTSTPTPTPEPSEPSCLICPQFIAPCNLACKKGYKCETQRQTCTSCPRNACVPDNDPTHTTPDDPKYETIEIPEKVEYVPGALEIHNDIEIVRDFPIDDPTNPALY
ncbi:hypothetical protein K7432_000215 [Basidiobolus ranarum]|uniref:Membrane anchor Opy2 N-terminal domain-containing protein n=1 Tax=Basidiobolus ranarum TaxID=34480 RepID=A0ABR2WBJ6_9FUNG